MKENPNQPKPSTIFLPPTKDLLKKAVDGMNYLQVGNYLTSFSNCLRATLLTDQSKGPVHALDHLGGYIAQQVAYFKSDACDKASVNEMVASTMLTIGEAMVSAAGRINPKNAARLSEHAVKLLVDARAKVGSEIFDGCITVFDAQKGEKSKTDQPLGIKVTLRLVPMKEITDKVPNQKITTIRPLPPIDQSKIGNN